MNPTAVAATEPPLPPVAQPPRSSFSCDRHPEEQFTGFCPECLCERLAGLDKSSSAPRKSNAGGGATTSSAAAAALKAIFRGSSSGAADKGSNRNSTSSKPSSSFFAELRRTKSFSASKGEGFSGVFEPQRKSCDVRVRNTLWSLFSQDDARKTSKKETRAAAAADIEIDTKPLGSSSVGGPVFESKEEDEIENENEEEEEEVEVETMEEEEEDGEIRVSEEALNEVSPVFEDSIEEIVEEEEEEEEVAVVGGGGEVEEDLKPMKDHIDLDAQIKKPAGRDLKGSFWSAASVFSKKLQKWRRKQKLKKQGNGSASAMFPGQKRLGRQYRETQSEIADYGFGRRSCDTDPRFSLDAARMSLDASRMSLDAGRVSLDAGRMSLDNSRMSLDAGRMSIDDPRYSFDEPRASWDGYLIGRTFPRLPPMLSVVEDAPVHVSRTDNQIPVEAPMNCINEDEAIPGGSAQTRDYYTDSSSRRRKSLDRSSSIRKTAAAVVAEIDDMKSVSNAKVSPPTVDLLQGSKILGADRELRDSNSNSLRDDCSETFDLAFRDAGSVIGNGDQKPPSKKSRRWKVWNIWGLIYRRNKDEDEDRFSRLNGVERSFSESWQEFRREGNGEVKGAFNRRVFRSNSSVSSRNLYNLGGGGSFGSVRKSSVEANGHHGKKRKDEFVLERNRSARYSPNNIENGLLRFYLTPLRGSRRSGVGKTRPNNSHSIARSVLRLY